jgi:thymidylate kinase
MTRAQAILVSVDGVNGAAVKVAARLALANVGRARRGGVSVWDASGLFEELAVADDDAGTPSPRTLLLLFAADLAFRLRWEIEPALAEGKMVVAAPYVETAVAFGRATGISGTWLDNLFNFAPRPGERRYVDAAPPRALSDRQGFIEFCSERVAGMPTALTRQQLLNRARAQLQAAARRGRARQA